jgi:NADPH:quinone reductase-like Zn-dependent oxidoreductase
MTPDIPAQMAAVLLTGHGGIDTLSYREDVALPVAGPDEVLIRVAAAGVNNTDINTRIGWYSKKVSDATDSGGADGFENVDDADATWSGVPMIFPRIQGADCCGVIVAVGEQVDNARIGERVIVRNMLRSYVDYRPFECWTFGSECDGAFAQFTRAPSRETHRVDCDWSDAELASIPCAYSTAENMLQRAAVGPERVLITGAARARPTKYRPWVRIGSSIAVPTWSRHSVAIASTWWSTWLPVRAGPPCSKCSGAGGGMPPQARSRGHWSNWTCVRFISRT